VKRLVNHRRDFVGIGHQVRVLGAVHGEPGGVRLLKGVTADGGGAHLARDGDQRSRVHLCVLEGCDEVGCPWPGGGHSHTHPAGRHRVALGHMAGTLLMTGQHVTYRAVEQRVVGGENRPARNTEDRLHALVLEALEQ